MKIFKATIFLLLFLVLAVNDLEAKGRKQTKRSPQRRPAAVQETHVDFDDLMIEGQNRRSSAFHFLERVNKNDKSRVKQRRHFRTEILESL